MGVEAEAMIDAIAGVDVAPRRAALRAPEELAIGTGRGAIAPDPREWQAAVRIDEAGERREVAVAADIGVMGSQELIESDATARRRNARQAAIGSPCVDRGQNSRRPCRERRCLA